MDFSFGIITSGQETERVQSTIQSIEDLNIPTYEIIVVGDSSVGGNKVKIVDFDESIRPMWITKKKNLITNHAAYNNIVYAHDYLIFCPGWYQGFLNHGDDFEICMNVILNKDGSRYADWCLDAMLDMELFGEVKNGKLIPYELVGVKDLSKIMYISGAYWVAKKDFMLRFPLNEDHAWGESEDVEWSHRIRKETTLRFNPKSSVALSKQKRMGYRLLSHRTMAILSNLSENNIEKFHRISNEKWQYNLENGLL